MAKMKTTEAQTLRAIIDFLEPQQALGKLVYIRLHPVHPFTDKAGKTRFAKVRESQKGAPDLLVIKPAPRGVLPLIEVMAIEVKSPTGKQSDDQKRWQERFEAVGGEYWLIRSVDEFLSRAES